MPESPSEKLRAAVAAREAAMQSPAQYQTKLAVAASRADRPPIDFTDSPFHNIPLLSFPIGYIFPLRVLATPRAMICVGDDGCGTISKRAAKVCSSCGRSDTLVEGRTPVQNFWVGRDGPFVHILEGGVNEDGSPMGIPGHSLPQAVTIDLCTQYKMASAQIGREAALEVRLGAYLPEYMRRLGMRGNFRGRGVEGDPKKDKPGRAIERINQYLACTHRILTFPNDQIWAESRDAYKAIRAASCVGDDALKDALRDSTTRASSDYTVWTRADLCAGHESNFMARVAVTPEFRDDFIDRSVPLVPEIVAKCMRSPQLLLLYVWVARRLHVQMNAYAMGASEWTSWIRIQSIQDQIGLNGDQTNRRPDITLDALKELMYIWNQWCQWKCRPGAELRFEPRNESGTHYWAEVRFLAPKERLVLLPGDVK